MPGRKSAHSAPVPLNVAIQIAGSAERLFEGVPAKTRAGIERRGVVPAFRVVPFLLENIGAQTPRPAASRALPRAVRDLLRALEPGMTFEPLAGLKPGALKAYEDRVTEIEGELQDFARKKLRELGELRDALMTRFK